MKPWERTRLIELNEKLIPAADPSTPRSTNLAVDVAIDFMSGLFSSTSTWPALTAPLGDSNCLPCLLLKTGRSRSETERSKLHRQDWMDRPG